MYCKFAALPQHAERFEQQFLFVFAWYVVVHIVACNGIETFIREIELYRIAVYKVCIFNAFCFGIVLA